MIRRLVIGVRRPHRPCVVARARRPDRGLARRHPRADRVRHDVHADRRSSAAADAAGAPTGTFFIALVGSDFRPGVGGARGDALHLVGVNPTTQHRDDAQRAARHVLAGRQDQPGPRAGRPARHGERARRPHRRPGRRTSCRSTSPASKAIVDGSAACRSTSRCPMDDKYSGARVRARRPTAERRPGAGRSPATATTSRRATSRASSNQGLLILVGARAAATRSARAPSASSRPRRCSAGTRSSTASASATSTGSAASPNSSNPAAVRNVTIPVGGGSCLPLVGDAHGLFADFADDATLQAH